MPHIPYTYAALAKPIALILTPDFGHWLFLGQKIMTGQSFRQQFCASLAPVVLVLIALLQLYLAHTHYLTPWKGGGFGMFASVDSRGARFLRIYLESEDGSYPVEVPPGLNHLAQELRSIPMRRHMTTLASQLVQATWVRSEYGSYDPAQVLSATQIQPATDESSLNTGDRTDSALPAVIGDEQPLDQVNSLSLNGQQPRFRALENFEPIPPAPLIADFARLRMELWRFEFDTVTQQVNARKLFQITVDKAE